MANDHHGEPTVGHPDPPVELRETSERDARAFLDLYVGNREFLEPFEPVRPAAFFTPEGIAADLARSVRDRRSDWQFAFGIWERATGALVGRIGLSNIVRGAWQNATLGYFVAEAQNGLGYATWAVREALAFGFGWADLHRVQAAIMPRNERSARVVEKNGFRPEGLAKRYLKINGVWEDHDVWAITREEWESLRARPGSGSSSTGATVLGSGSGPDGPPVRNGS